MMFCCVVWCRVESSWVILSYSYCRVVVFGCVVFFRIVLFFSSVLLPYFIEFFLVASISYFHPPFPPPQRQSLSQTSMNSHVQWKIVKFTIFYKKKNDLWIVHWDLNCASEFPSLFLAFSTLFVFGFSERRNLWNCEWNCERFAHNVLNYLCATDFSLVSIIQGRLQKS